MDDSSINTTVRVLRTSFSGETGFLVVVAVRAAEATAGAMEVGMGRR